MSVSIRDSFHTALCETLFQDLVSGREKYYYFIGNISPWNLSDIPPDYAGTLDEEMAIRNEIILAKRVTNSDIAFGVKRYDWTPLEVYDQFDSALPLIDKKFYVLTDDFNVYKCLGNNEFGQSTSKPTGTDYTPVQYPDGYWWKYMYTIPKSLRNKFLLPDIMPVFRALNDSFYDNGNIKDVFVTNGGTGYQNAPQVSVAILGGSPTTPADLRPIVGQNGSILDIKIKNPGFYATTPTLSIVGNAGATGLYPGNSTAKAEAILVDNQIVRVVITDPGQGYLNDIRTTIVISGDGEGAVLTPGIVDGVIEDVYIENEGSGYTFANLSVVSAFDPDQDLVPGSGAVLTANLSQGNLDSIQSIVEQTAIPGAIYLIDVFSTGIGYTEGVQVVIEGDGTGATATAIVSNGGIAKIEMNTIGSGYTYATVSFVGTFGTGAVARAIISPLRGHGFDAVKELNADSLILSSTINNEAIQGVKIKNDYRQYGIFQNPRAFGTSREYTSLIGSASHKIRIDGSLTFERDDKLIISDTKFFTVVEQVVDVLIIKSDNNMNISVGELGVKEGTIDTFSILEVTNPDINKYTGNLHYVNNQAGIDYSEQQLLTLKTVITL